MKDKYFELTSLTYCSGCYLAVVYNRLCGYWKEYRFFYYTKKETIYKLRHEYGVTVPRGF